MIYLKSNNKFFLENFSIFLTQENFNFTISKNENFFFVVSIDLYEKYLKITSGDNSVSINCPARIQSIFSSIRNILIDKYVTTKNFNYSPISQTLLIKDKSCILGSIHNLIISNLIMNLEDGIDKNFLYKQIWPKDKDIQINKLDTHITNLKNKIKNDLSLNIKIISLDGSLRLIID